MPFQDIVQEYEANGRISQHSVDRLRTTIRSDDPFDAITVATDCAVFDLVPDIARCLDDSDSMVRWNAAGSLFTRFRIPLRVDKAFDLAMHDEDSTVRIIALCGLGELLPKLDRHQQREAASLLLSTFRNENASLGERSAA